MPYPAIICAIGIGHPPMVLSQKQPKKYIKINGSYPLGSRPALD
jgi:hypothetical protein